MNDLRPKCGVPWCIALADVDETTGVARQFCAVHAADATTRTAKPPEVKRELVDRYLAETSEYARA